MKRFSSLLFFYCLLLLQPVHAASEIKLFKEFSYGMSKEQLLQMPSVFDCSEEVEPNALCIEQTTFSQQPVSVVLRISQNKLVEVMLATDYSHDNYIAFFSALKSKFELVALEDVIEGQRFDVIHEIKTQPQEEVMRKITEFEVMGLLQS